MSSKSEVRAFIAPQIEFVVQEHPERLPSLAIFFVGCLKRCPDCHNKDLWEVRSDNSIEVDVVSLCRKILTMKKDFPFLRGLVLLGGEPQLYSDFLSFVLPVLKKVQFNIVLYTGYDFVDSRLIPYLDWIKFGGYQKELRNDVIDTARGLFASANQKIIRVNGNGVYGQGVGLVKLEKGQNVSR